VLADRIGVRAAAIVGPAAAVQERARFSASAHGGSTAMNTMLQRLHAYFELDTYLTHQGLVEA
jgi:hypothetical protein